MAEALLLEHGSALELRAEGRTLRAKMPYGQRARTRAERFLAGSLTPQWPLGLNLQHDPAVELASSADRSLRLRDTTDAMIVEADLPRATHGDEYGVLGLVRRGVLKGISPEFHARRESRSSNGERIIEEAVLVGFGLVDDPAYPTPLELRAAEWLQGVIPYGTPLACECVDGCEYVEFAPGAFDGLGDDGDVLAVGGGGFGNVLGSLRRGTLRLRETADGLEVGLTDASTPTAEAVTAASKVSDVYVRPILDQAASVATDITFTGIRAGVGLGPGARAQVRLYTAANVRAFLVKPTTTTEGHTPAKIVEPTATAPPPDVAPLAAAPAAGAGHPGGTDPEARAVRRQIHEMSSSVADLDRRVDSLRLLL